jgi:hypothetical protein
VRIAARMHAWFEIPYGYQDERGFHYGRQVAPKRLAEADVSGTRVFTDRACDAMTYPIALPKLTSEAPEPCARAVAPASRG